MDVAGVGIEADEVVSRLSGAGSYSTSLMLQSSQVPRLRAVRWIERRVKSVDF